jgi:hypothetical protein
MEDRLKCPAANTEPKNNSIQQDNPAEGQN